MFAVQRFDGSGSTLPQGSTKDAKPDRIALINQRKAAQQQLQQGEASTSKVTLPSLPSTNAANTTPAPLDTSKPVPTIHPSRLAVSHVLRQADRKAKSSLNGGVKERTKAKQRYLKTKKERRKKRKAVEATKGRKGKAATTWVDTSAHNTENSTKDASEDSESDEEDESEEDKEGVSQQDVAEPMVVDESKEVQVASSRGEHAVSTSQQDSSEEEGDDDDAQEEAEEMEEGAGEGEGEGAGVSQTEHETTDKPNEDESMPPHFDEESAALSRFPAPRRTLQASRKDLAAQGLPPGLANPQRIDPTLTTSVKKSDHTNLDQISPAMKDRLAKLGITQWFAVQTAVIPLLLSHPLSKSLYPKPPLSDLCVSAPTGSGKTLSYAVPIVEVLSERLNKRLRALIILPTRDLVNQVKETMVQVSKGTQLSIAVITGQQNIVQEQSMLMEVGSIPKKRKVAGVFTDEIEINQEQEEALQSKIDILIATPGRLIDHLEQTPGFTLQHLRFLVIDEADRLLGQSFQEWLPRILEGLNPENKSEMDEMKSHIQGGRDMTNRYAPAWIMERRLHSAHSGTAMMQGKEEAGVQKLLFSATLTRDPAKILALKLRNAAFVSVEEEESDRQDQMRGHTDFIDRQENFTLPASLKEHMIVTKGEEKPLELLYLLFGQEPRLRQALCFTKSVENAARLVKLVDYFQQNRQDRIVVKEYSSDLSANQRSRLLSAFKSNEIDLLVCSDVIARGIDLPDVRHVISYDVPIDMAKYVHRVGRTARANRVGDAWTLVEEQEARHFKRMMKRGGRKEKMEKVKTKAEDRDLLRNDYSIALSRLENLYARKV